MPVHAAMQQAMQMQQHKHKTTSSEELDATLAESAQQSHCEMQSGQQAVVSANTSSDDSCCCPPALCDAVEAQQDQLFQQDASIQLFASLAFYPASFELQTDTVQSRGIVSLRFYDLHYRQISRPPLSLNTVLLI